MKQLFRMFSKKISDKTEIRTRLHQLIRCYYMNKELNVIKKKKREVQEENWTLISQEKHQSIKGNNNEETKFQR